MFLVYESDTLHRKIQTYDKKNELKTKIKIKKRIGKDDING